MKWKFPPQHSFQDNEQKMRFSFGKICPFLILILLSYAASSFAGGGAGGTGANFLKIGAGARAVAMGEAFTGLADDTTAVYWNPAGLALIRGMGLTSTHGEWIEGVKHEFFAAHIRRPLAGAFGASFTYLGTGKFREQLETDTGEYGGEGALISAADFALSGAYAQRLGLWIPGEFFRRSSAGVKATFVGQKAVEVKGYGVSFDIGYMYEIKRRRLYVGAVVQNAGTKIQDASQPLRYKAGASYKKKKIFSEHDRGIVAMDFDGHVDTGFNFNIGTEYSRKFGTMQMALRAGYRTGGNLGALAGLTSGFGIAKTFGDTVAILDYAFVPYGVLGFTHRISLSFRLGGRPAPPEPSLESPTEFHLEKPEVRLKLSVKSEEPIRSWKVTIRNEEGNPVQTFEGEGRPPTKLDWDGMDKDKKPLPEGSYHLDLEVKDWEDQIARSPDRPLEARTPPTPTPEPEKFVYPYAFQFSTDLLFERGGAELKPKALQSLNQALGVINLHFPDALFLIEGHTDNMRLRAGSLYESNDELSLVRAEVVQNYIVGKGIFGDRIHSLGFGDKRPLYSNETRQGQAGNRRVEMIVYGKKKVHQDDFIQDMTVLVGQGAYRKAATDLLRAAWVYPDDWRIYRLLGDCFAAMGDVGRSSSMPQFS